MGEYKKNDADKNHSLAHTKADNQNYQLKNNRADNTKLDRFQDSVNNSTKVIQQKEKVDAISDKTVQRKENNTGLPDQLKSGIESLSGIDMSDTRVHYNSSQPAQLQAHAYAQGNNIHIAPGQEQHLPHEAWHVVQQKQGRVKPTTQLKGKTLINDDAGLEREADVMGAKAASIPLQKKSSEGLQSTVNNEGSIIQRVVGWTAAACASGTTLYHNTGQDGAISLMTDGVRQVQNAWGGGALGAGFYTHKTRGGAEVYGQARFTIRYRVTGNLNGQVVPRRLVGLGIPADTDYLTGNDFLTNPDDADEIKLHSGAHIVAVEVYDNQSGTTYNNRQQFINAILGN